MKGRKAQHNTHMWSTFVVGTYWLPSKGPEASLLELRLEVVEPVPMLESVDVIPGLEGSVPVPGLELPQISCVNKSQSIPAALTICLSASITMFMPSGKGVG